MRAPSSKNEEIQDSRESQANLQAALARTATRSIALYFSRPVRLFRPSKVSGWHSLRGLASREGTALNVGFVTSLVKNQGFMVIPKHFIPPMVVNAILGTVLWTTYAEVSSFMELRTGSHPIFTAALSGGIAGGTQALVAAPAENVRLLLEGGTVYHSWSHAWKEVFRGTSSRQSDSPQQNKEDIRQVRRWMKDVGDMAGRGWDGWGWGCAKDICGFAVFFSIFEVTRQIALEVREIALRLKEHEHVKERSLPFVRQMPTFLHGVTLVSGGVLAGLAYELTGRPWDHARRIVHLHRLAITHDTSVLRPLIHQFRAEGSLSFFRDPALHHTAATASSPTPRKLVVFLRTLGRVGPWGIGFLAWEAFGPGLNS